MTKKELLADPNKEYLGSLERDGRWLLSGLRYTSRTSW